MKIVPLRPDPTGGATLVQMAQTSIPLVSIGAATFGKDIARFVNPMGATCTSRPRENPPILLDGGTPVIFVEGLQWRNPMMGVRLISILGAN